MTITVTKNGSVIAGMIWTNKSRWTSAPQYVHQTIPYADKGLIYSRGKDNATCTLNGRILKGTANAVTVTGLEGATITVSTSNEAQRTAYVTSISTADRGAWWYLTLSITEV